MAARASLREIRNSCKRSSGTCTQSFRRLDICLSIFLLRRLAERAFSDRWKCEWKLGRKVWLRKGAWEFISERNNLSMELTKSSTLEIGELISKSLIKLTSFPKPAKLRFMKDREVTRWGERWGRARLRRHEIRKWSDSKISLTGSEIRWEREAGVITRSRVLPSLWVGKLICCIKPCSRKRILRGLSRWWQLGVLKSPAIMKWLNVEERK